MEVEEQFQSHKHQKLVEALRANSINKENPLPEWRYTGHVDISGAHITGGKNEIKCLCTTPISKYFQIQNIYTKKNEIIGCECIKKFLENSVKCKTCDNTLRNLGVRLNENNMICPSCKKKEKTKEKTELKEKMNHYGEFRYFPYNNHLHHLKGHKFKDIKRDEILIEYIVNQPPPAAPWKSYDCLMEYISYHYKIC